MAAARAASSSPPSSPWRSRRNCRWTSTCDASALVVRGGSQPLRLVEHAPGLGQPAAFDQRGAQLGEQRDPPWIIGGKQPGNPLEQADRRGQVAADKRPPSCRLEPVGRPGGKRGRRARRAGRARHGTGRPVRGGSRRSPRTRAAGPRPLARARRRSARADRPARSSAASDRRRRGSGRGGSGRPSRRRSRRPPGGSDPGGRAPAGRPRAACRASGQASSPTALRWNTAPSTAAVVRIARSSAGRPSRRAARSALIVEGTGSSARSDEATQRSASRA